MSQTKTKTNTSIPVKIAKKLIIFSIALLLILGIVTHDSSAIHLILWGIIVLMIPKVIQLIKDWHHAQVLAEQEKLRQERELKKRVKQREQEEDILREEKQGEKQKAAERLRQRHQTKNKPDYQKL